MQIETETTAAGQIVRILDNRIDAAVAIRFKEDLRELTEGGTGTVLMDLSRVDFLDSSGLGAVVAVMKMLAPQRKLELAGLTPTVAKVFRLTRMDSVFTIRPNPPSATTDPLRSVG